MNSLHKLLEMRGKMRISLRTKLTVSFLIVVVVSGVVATLMGARLIGDGIIAQAQSKVRLDLNAAREIYHYRLRDIRNVLDFAAIRMSIREALLREDRVALRALLEEVRRRTGLDVLTITDRTGRVVLRARNPEVYGDDVSRDEIVAEVLLHRKSVASTQIVSAEELEKEGADLAERARIGIKYTPKAKPTSAEEETSGTMLKAAVPVFDDGTFVGVLYGGNLLNRNYELVDRMKDTLYQDERYKGKNMGTATIFQGDLRISTNVMNADGTRAIGTRVSEVVYDQVMAKGKFWIDRAFVVNDWYITAYEPIRNIRGDVIGILYVGILEQKFVDMRRETVWIFLGITFAGMVVALVIGYFLADTVAKPIRKLVAASEEISKGNLSYQVALRSKDEIGELERAFNTMASSLRDRDATLRAETQRQLIRSEKLASLGRLAAGVAHEINNPLTGVLTFSSLLLRHTDENDPQREDLETIVHETNRCKEIVKGLLEFSRQTEPQKKRGDVNEIIREALSLMENQALIHNVKIVQELNGDLPGIVVDTDQIQQVFVNVILNALDAMPEGGTLRVRSDSASEGHAVQVAFGDTGHGIPPEHIDKVFDPFFTTKSPNKGTGLGLAVSYGIIERHGGKIEVESEGGVGTTFMIALPVEER